MIDIRAVLVLELMNAVIMIRIPFSFHVALNKFISNNGVLFLLYIPSVGAGGNFTRQIDSLYHLHVHNSLLVHMYMYMCTLVLPF